MGWRIILMMLALPFTPGIAQESASSSRSMVNLNPSWRYIESQAEKPDLLPANGDNGWQQVDLPHSWNQYDATDLIPGYRRDVSWYVKDLQMDWNENARQFLYLEGANLVTSVFANGKWVGTHEGGYVGFRMELTDFLQKEGPNQIAIRVDNSHDHGIIPSNKADFFIFGGITRDVWLEERPLQHIHNLRIHTPNVSKSSAELTVSLDWHAENLKGTKLSAKLIHPDGKTEIWNTSQNLNRKASLTDFAWELPKVNDPLLWSPDNPNRYELELTWWNGHELIDQVSEKIGFRWFSFEAYGAFFLNGERLLLRGTHRHEDHAGYGAAIPNEVHRQDIQLIKDMGANFVRLGHYPQDPVVYEMCDSIGLIVWDELPWCRGGVGDQAWKSRTAKLLEEQILQNYNHPSIFFWALGNEVYWEPDFEGGGDPARINEFLKSLNDLSHELDPSRMTAIRKYYDGAHLVDVFSPSIWSGWYAGVYTNYQKSLETERTKYPQFLHMEYGGSSHAGRHTETPVTGIGVLSGDNWAEVSNQAHIKNIAKGGDWSENYIVDLFDWHLHVSEQLDWFAGNAQWAIKDFGTPLRPENAIPYINQKGLVDRAGNPKDAYYVFKSYWSDDPFAYIESHTWTYRTGHPDSSHLVKVFSNAAQVELIHQGISLGIKEKDLSQFPASGLAWNLPFAEGENELLAKGFDASGNEVCADTLHFEYVTETIGKPSELSLSAQKLPNGHYLVEAWMKDKAGNRCSDFEDRVYFGLSGLGELMQDLGTPTGSRSIEMANGRAAIEFIPSPEGRGTISVRSQHFKGGFLIFQDGEPQDSHDPAG
ncbi:glycoside hydrolase family 2 TIM barrel-domain containing protein [Pontibacter sp. G13]|uniref:glycoside hydrolase family 2 protein n=1 Tax=Pontibacter sp. G13 TaxID=3074898 RepID=UPI002889323D|nr:glycoside hydrolase family 2 TIM barrel-domain containing protein [Pontibacter sp. G13]WNJ15906.1 glycoside hydrolase family 2 TIM barrel-domain containing protein [Pontibacter sp. G13]